jgi:hypothetical protein
LGRLVRVIDEQGRVTEYVYDAAGNLLQVIGGAPGSAQPPVVTASTPGSIRRGETRSFQVTGTGLSGAHVSTSDPALDVSGLHVSATQVLFSLTAAAGATLGSRQISISNAAGVTSIQVTVNPVLPKLGVTPQPIAVPPNGTQRSYFVTLSNADNIDHTVSIVSANPATASVSPASITFTAGQTERLISVAGQAAGLTALNLSAPGLAPTSVPVFVTVEFSGISTSFSPPLGVLLEQAPVPTSTTLGPIASPVVGVALGAYMTGVAPNRLGIGTGPTDLVISGSGLGGVTGVTITPADGLTLGTLSVAGDGNSVTLPVTVAPGAPTTPRKVTLLGASQPYLAARPDADRILVTLPPPQLESIDPIFSRAGSAVVLSMRGRNLQGARVALTPSIGIAVSNAASVNAEGTFLTVEINISLLAPTGARVVTVTTPGGTSVAVGGATNTFTVVNDVFEQVTPVAAPILGILKVDDTPPPAQSLSAFASLLGVVVPPAATTISPAVGIVGQSVTLTVNGFGLNAVTAVQISPAEGLTLGAPTPAPDGLSLTVPVTIALNAPPSLREVQLFAGASQVLFTDAAASLFRVSLPLAEFDSMTPIVLQAGAAPVTLTLTGRNFQNATQLRVEPPSGITVTALSVNGAGTQASVSISASAAAASGPRAVILVTPAGSSSTALSAANTLTLTSLIQGSVSPVVAAHLGVVLQDTQPPASETFGPIVSADVGVVIETAPPAAEPDTAFATQLGVAVGPFVTGVQAPPLTPNSTGTLTISGVALGSDVTAVQIVPPTGAAVGALTIAPDGTQITTPLTLSAAPAGLRGVRVLRGAEALIFVPAGLNTFRIGVGVPSIDSITPIVERRGQTFTMTLRGQNFPDVTAVTATPGSGILIDSVSPNAAGTELTVRVVIAADAPLGAHVIRITTPGGSTTGEPIPANTFTVLE